MNSTSTSHRWSALVERRRAGHHRDRVLNIAHRGARAVAPENTIQAIDKAAGLGADMVEIDVHLSADGELVVTHDLPARLTLAEIQAKDPRIPTLPQCLARALELSLLVNVEIKNLPVRYPRIDEMVVAAIERLDATRHVIVSSFDHEAVAAVRRLNGQVATAVLTDDRLYQPADYLARLDADALHPGSGSVPDAETVETIRATGRGVNVWTENDVERMRTLVAAGVTGIVTDYPDRLRALLDAVAHGSA